MQAVLFSFASYEPAEHGSHAGLPNDAEKLPGEHAAGSMLPVAQLEPGRHSRHSSGPARSVALEKRPFGHG